MGIVGKVGSAIKRAALYVPRRIGIVSRPFAVPTFHGQRKADMAPYCALDHAIFMNYGNRADKLQNQTSFWEKAHVTPEDVRLAEECLGQFGVTALKGGGIIPVQLNLDPEFAGPDAIKEIIAQAGPRPASVEAMSVSLFARIMNALWRAYDRLLGQG